MTPEQRARSRIDQQLEQAGWIVQDYREMYITASIAVYNSSATLPGRLTRRFIGSKGPPTRTAGSPSRTASPAGVQYHPGPKIESMCAHAVRELGPKQSDFDSLLDYVAKMDTDQAELFATAYAAWNDLLLDGRPDDDDSIITEIYGWDESKKKFTRDRIGKCLGWMRKNRYFPSGQGIRTVGIVKKLKLGLKPQAGQTIE